MMQQEKEQSDEMQLTDGIQKLIELDLKVYAVKLPADVITLGIWNLESRCEAFKLLLRPQKEQTRQIGKKCLSQGL